MRRAGLILVALVLAALAVGAAAAPRAADVRGVAVKDDFFSPRARTAEPGDTIRFRWAGENAHNVKFTKVPKGAAKPKSCKLRTSGKCARKVGKAGVYRIVCTIHLDDEDMRGRIVVE